MSEQATPPPAVTPPPDEHQRVEAARRGDRPTGVVVRPDDEQFGRAQPGLGHRAGGVDHHRCGNGGRPVRLRRQHAHDPSLRLGDRRRQHRHDVRDHRRWHRPVRRGHRGACVGLGDDPRHPDHGGGHPLARHGVRRAGGGHRLRCGQRRLDRLRAGWHRSSPRSPCSRRHAAWPRSSPNAGPRSWTSASSSSSSAGAFSGSRAGLDLRSGLGHRLGAAQPDHVRTPHDFRRWQLGRRPPRWHQCQAAHAVPLHCSWASPAASPRS